MWRGPLRGGLKCEGPRRGRRGGKGRWYRAQIGHGFFQIGKIPEELGKLARKIRIIFCEGPQQPLIHPLDLSLHFPHPFLEEVFHQALGIFQRMHRVP